MIITGVDDNIIDGTILSTLTIAINDENSDDNFDTLNDHQISISTQDDDVAGFTIVETDGSTIVNEAGDTDTFAIVLNAQPTSNVQILVSQPTDPQSGQIAVQSVSDEATIATTVLTFTPENWNIPQSVTVTEPMTSVSMEIYPSKLQSKLILQFDDDFDAVAEQTVTEQTSMMM